MAALVETMQMQQTHKEKYVTEDAELQQIAQAAQEAREARRDEMKRWVWGRRGGGEEMRGGERREERGGVDA